MSSDLFAIADRKFHSRLLIGSARYPNPKIMVDSIKASGAEIVTVSMRHVFSIDKNPQGILKDLDRNQFFLLPNTAGCFTAKEAVLTAHLAREALETPWIKLEVIGDKETCLPDIPELLKAASELVQDGFIVLPYCNDDLITCRKLADMGCSAIMPLGAPIGSGLGICNPHNLQIIRHQITLPLIIDAGIGTASDAVLAMELGADGVLINTAIAQAQNPCLMAQAMKHACLCGRQAYLSGRIPRKLFAQASSPHEGILTL